jgi:hypothetical protein
MYRAERVARRLRRALCRHVYFDRNRDPGASILVAGSARSGTTWLGDLLAHATRARVVFEPFHHELVEGFRPFGAFPYRRETDVDSDLTAWCEQMLAGKLSGSWVDRGVERFVSSRRVVKAVRANLLLAWFTRRFPTVPTVLVVRHPCAVIASRMAMGWDPQPDLDSILCQTRLVEDHLQPYRAVIGRADSEEARNAIVWCVHHLVPLRQIEGSAYTTVFYEELCTNPEIELARLASVVRGTRDVSESRTRKPSTTSRTASAAVTGESRVTAWQRMLEPRQVDTILGVVRSFGLDSLYDESPMPLSNPFVSPEETAE